MRRRATRAGVAACRGVIVLMPEVADFELRRELLQIGSDVSLAAQALLVGATVVTDNPKHFGRMVDTTAWDRVLARS